MKKIKNIREELEITQEDISRVLGCTRTAYSLWKINKNTIPLYYLNKISNEYVYFNEDGTVKETNYKRKYDYFIAGMSCYDDEYPTHR